MKLPRNCSGLELANKLAEFALQERGELFLVHADEVYEGMLVGIHSRANDLVVNPTKAKQLTNIRAAGTDENLTLTSIQKMTLEQALKMSVRGRLRVKFVGAIPCGCP